MKTAIPPPRSARIGSRAFHQTTLRPMFTAPVSLPPVAQAPLARVDPSPPPHATLSARALKLTRPLVAFDLEASGINVQRDEIIEFGAVKRFPDGRPDETKVLRIKPGCPISPFALRAHGISAFELRHAPPFADHAQDITAFLTGCDLVGHNVKRFDIPMLGHSLARAAGKTWGLDFLWPPLGTHVLDTLDLFRRFVPDKAAAGGNHKLGTCYTFYTERTIVNAHSALPDAQACMDVVEAMAAASIAGVKVGLAVCRDTVPLLDEYGRTSMASQKPKRSRWQGNASARAA